MGQLKFESHGMYVDSQWIRGGRLARFVAQLILAAWFERESLVPTEQLWRVISQEKNAPNTRSPTILKRLFDRCQVTALRRYVLADKLHGPYKWVGTRHDWSVQIEDAPVSEVTLRKYCWLQENLTNELEKRLPKLQFHVRAVEQFIQSQLASGRSVLTTSNAPADIPAVRRLLEVERLSLDPGMKAVSLLHRCRIYRRQGLYDEAEGALSRVRRALDCETIFKDEYLTLSASLEEAWLNYARARHERSFAVVERVLATSLSSGHDRSIRAQAFLLKGLYHRWQAIRYRKALVKQSQLARAFHPDPYLEEDVGMVHAHLVDHLVACLHGSLALALQVNDLLLVKDVLTNLGYVPFDLLCHGITGQVQSRSFREVALDGLSLLRLAGIVRTEFAIGGDSIFDVIYTIRIVSTLVRRNDCPTEHELPCGGFDQLDRDARAALERQLPHQHRRLLLALCQLAVAQGNLRTARTLRDQLDRYAKERNHPIEVDMKNLDDELAQLQGLA